jgi:hypothetical protein
MAERNVARVAAGHDYIWVDHPTVSHASRRFNDMEVRVLGDGSEVRTWLHGNRLYNCCAVVARWIPVADLILSVQISHDIERIVVEFVTLAGDLKCTAEFSTKRCITYGYLGWHVHEALMIRESCSKFVTLKLVQGMIVKSPQDCCWSPSWENRALKPDRRLVGKQPYRLRKTLDLYFAKVPRAARMALD